MIDNLPFIIVTCENTPSRETHENREKINQLAEAVNDIRIAMVAMLELLEKAGIVEVRPGLEEENDAKKRIIRGEQNDG